MADLRSAPLPELAADDHVRGAADAPLVIEYGDLECPHCAALALQARALVADGAVRWAYRHFPLRSTHPRAWQAACASEAAALQGAFWEMHDALLGDQGRLEDPHLWQHAETLGLDLQRFEADRRGEAVQERVARDFNAGVRAGVVTAPTVFWEGRAVHGEGLRAVLAKLRRH